MPSVIFLSCDSSDKGISDDEKPIIEVPEPQEELIIEVYSELGEGIGANGEKLICFIIKLPGEKEWSLCYDLVGFDSYKEGYLYIIKANKYKVLPVMEDGPASYYVYVETLSKVEI